MRRALVPGLLALIATAWVGAARADEASEAKLQFELGDELYRQQRLPEAIDRFVASNRLVPNANIVFNIATTYSALAKRELKKRETRDRAPQHFVEAYNWIETFLRFEKVPDAERQEGVKLRETLIPRVALVDVTSSPAGADIVIDREALGSVGRAPRLLATVPGDHTVILKAPGYRDGTAPAAARVGTTVAVSVALEQITGTLKIDSTPPGAKVRIEETGEELGPTPLSRAVPIGTLRLTLTQAGYLEQARTVSVTDTAIAALSVTLLPAASLLATLSVTGTPANAIVTLDGRPVGQLPTSTTNLPAGRGRLQVTAPSFQSWTGEIPLEAGGATRVAISLTPQEKPIWPGWKWVGYGGGAACLAAGAAVGLAARSAKDDFDASPSGARYDRVDTLNVTADALMIVGATTVLTTAALHWFWPRAKTSHASVGVER